MSETQAFLAFSVMMLPLAILLEWWLRRFFRPLRCMFCARSMSLADTVTDDFEGVACRECAAAEIAAQRNERAASSVARSVKRP